MLVIDYFYLMSFGKKFAKLVENIQRSSFRINLVGVFISYLCLVVGLNFFVLSKKESTAKDAVQ